MVQRIDFPQATIIGNVADPALAQDAATKNYVDTRGPSGSTTLQNLTDVAITEPVFAQVGIITVVSISAATTSIVVTSTAGIAVGDWLRGGTVLPGQLPALQVISIAGNLLEFNSDPTPFFAVGNFVYSLPALLEGARLSFSNAQNKWISSESLNFLPMDTISWVSLAGDPYVSAPGSPIVVAPITTNVLDLASPWTFGIATLGDFPSPSEVCGVDALGRQVTGQYVSAAQAGTPTAILEFIKADRVSGGGFVINNTYPLTWRRGTFALPDYVRFNTTSNAITQGQAAVDLRTATLIGQTPTTYTGQGVNSVSTGFGNAGTTWQAATVNYAAARTALATTGATPPAAAGNWTLPAYAIRISNIAAPSALQFATISQIQDNPVNSVLVITFSGNPGYFANAGVSSQPLFTQTGKFTFVAAPQAEIIRLAGGGGAIPTLQQVTTAGVNTQVGIGFQDSGTNAILLKAPTTLANSLTYTLNLGSYPPINDSPLAVSTAGNIYVPGQLEVGNTLSNNLYLAPDQIRRTGAGALTILAGTGATDYIIMGSGSLDDVNRIAIDSGIAGVAPAIRSIGSANAPLTIEPAGSGLLTLGNTVTWSGITVGASAATFTQISAANLTGNCNLILAPSGTGDLFPIGAGPLSATVANQPTINIATAIGALTLGPGISGQTLTSNGILGAPYWATGSSAGNLQAVLNAGNTATNTVGNVSRIQLTDTLNATNPTQIDGSAVQSLNWILLGSVAGQVEIKASATTTLYPLILPPAQATAAGQVLANNGAGVLSWASGAAANLQAVLNAGNSATNASGGTSSIRLTDSVSTKITILDGTKVESQLVVFDGSVSGTTTLKAAATVTTSYTLTLPAAQATAAGQTLSNDGTGILSWASGAAANLQAVLNTGNSATNSGTNVSTIRLTDVATNKPTQIDGTAVQSQSLILLGSTSGTLDIKSAATTTNYTLFFPPAQASAAGQTLSNNGAGILSWVSAAAVSLQAVVNIGNTITNASGNTGSILITDSVSVKTTTLDGTRVKSQSLVLDGATSGSLTMKAAVATTSYQIVLPPAQGVLGQTLTNDGAGNLNWAFLVAPTLQLVLNSGNTATNTGTNISVIRLTDSVSTKTTTLDGTKVESQELFLDGSTSGFAAIRAAATTTSYTLTLPVAQATAAGQTLSNNGSGILSWVSVAAQSLQSVVNIGNSINTASGNTGVILIVDSTTAKTTTLSGTQVKSQSVVFDGFNSGSITIKAATATSSYPLTLPAAQATAAGQTLNNDGTGVLSWASGAAENLQSVLNTGNTATNSGINRSSILLTDSGTAKTTTLDGTKVESQSIVFDGSSSGSVTIRAAAAPTSYALVLPTAQAAAAGQTLLNDGSGNLSWSTVYAMVQDALGAAVAKRPTVQFTGSGVTSVVDDIVNNRTVVTITGGGGGGSFTSSAVWTGGTGNKNAYLSPGSINNVGITINLVASSGSGGITAAVVSLNSVALPGTYVSTGTWPNLVITIPVADITGNAAEIANTVSISLTGTFGGSGVNIANAGMLTNTQPVLFTTTLTGSYNVTSVPFYTTTATLDWVYRNTTGTVTAFEGTFTPPGTLAPTTTGSFPGLVITGSVIGGSATGTGTAGAGSRTVTLSGSVAAVPTFVPAFYTQTVNSTVPAFSTVDIPGFFQTPGAAAGSIINYTVASASTQYNWICTQRPLTSLFLRTPIGDGALVPDVTAPTQTIAGQVFNVFAWTRLTPGASSILVIT